MSLISLTYPDSLRAQPWKKEVDSLLIRLYTPPSPPDSLQAASFARLGFLLSDIAMDSALAYTDTALSLAQQGNYPHILARAQMARGAAYSNQGQYDSATAWNMQALATAEALGDDGTRFDALNNLGIDYFYQLDNERALHYFEQVEQLAATMADTNRWAYALNNVGLMYGTLGDVEKERRYYAQAAQLFQLNADEHGFANTVLNLGTLLQSVEKYDSAILAYEQALGSYQRLKINRGLTQTYLNLGEVYLEVGQAQRALEYIRLGESHAREHGYRDDLANLLRVKSKAFAEVGYPDSAYATHVDYHALQTDLLNAEKLQQIQELEVEYQTQEKEQALAALEREQALSQARNRNRMLLLLLVLLLACTLVGLLIWRNRLRQQHNRTLETTNEKLGELNAFKDQIFGTLAHDLKNPLSAFHSITRSLSQSFDQLPPSEIKGYLSHLQASAASVEELLHNLLQWSLSQMRQQTTTPQKVSVSETIAQVLSLYRVNCALKNHTVDTAISEDTYVLADPEQLRTILRNLLSNAIKFTPEGGKIRVEAQTTDREVRITISDSGIGIAQADLPRLFDPATNPKTIGESPEKGTGLGLRLSKELLEQQQGGLQVTSQPGQGSTFTITLPLAA